MSSVGTQPAAADVPGRASRSRSRADKRLTGRTLAWIGLATAVVAFGAGFGLAVVDTGPRDQGQAAAPVVAPVEEQTTTTAPPPSSTSSTVAIAPAPSVLPPTTPPTEPATTTTQPPTSAPITSPPTSAGSPARVQVQYPKDAQGRLVIAAGRSAGLTFTNVGGTVGQWFIQSGGYFYVVGPTSGVLQPNESRAVSIQAVPEVPSNGADTTINLIVSGQGSISIPLRINP